MLLKEEKEGLIPFLFSLTVHLLVILPLREAFGKETLSYLIFLFSTLR